jgi:hypothetical protein
MEQNGTRDESLEQQAYAGPTVGECREETLQREPSGNIDLFRANRNRRESDRTIIQKSERRMTRYRVFRSIMPRLRPIETA